MVMIKVICKAVYVMSMLFEHELKYYTL